MVTIWTKEGTVLRKEVLHRYSPEHIRIQNGMEERKARRVCLKNHLTLENFLKSQ